jgi:hypothetical protein
VEEGRGRAPFTHRRVVTPYNPAFWGNSEIGPSKGFGRVLKISEVFPSFFISQTGVYLSTTLALPSPTNPLPSQK